MMRFTLMIIIAAISCSSKDQSNQEDQCTESHKFQKLVAATIDAPEVQQYYNVQEVINQDSLVILKNEIIRNEITLRKFNLPVAVLSKDDIAKENIKAFIEFKSISIKGDSASVHFKYAIQGIECKAKFRLTKCSWKLTSSHLWEN